MSPIVVISCGKTKTDHAAPARELYTGGYFRAQLAYARTLTGDDRIYVLSAKHGFLPLDAVVEPYDLRMGQRGSVSAHTCQAQARRLGIAGEPLVIATTGSSYAQRVSAVWPHARFPLHQLPGEWEGERRG